MWKANHVGGCGALQELPVELTDAALLAADGALLDLAGAHATESPSVAKSPPTMSSAAPATIPFQASEQESRYNMNVAAAAIPRTPAGRGQAAHPIGLDFEQDGSRRTATHNLWMPVGKDAVTLLWRRALADAGLRDGDDAVLHVFDGINTPAMPGAMAVEPGACAWDIAGHLFPFLHQQQERSFASRDVYEVLTYAGHPDYVQLAVLRHELEHVRQYRQSRFLLRASTAIMGGLEEHLSHVQSLVRSLHIARPTERAADAAGRRLAAIMFGIPAAGLRGKGHDVLLFGPEDGPDESEIARGGCSPTSCSCPFGRQTRRSSAST